MLAQDSTAKKCGLQILDKDDWKEAVRNPEHFYFLLNKLGLLSYYQKPRLVLVHQIQAATRECGPHSRTLCSFPNGGNAGQPLPTVVFYEVCQRADLEVAKVFEYHNFPHFYITSLHQPARPNKTQQLWGKRKHYQSHGGATLQVRNTSVRVLAVYSITDVQIVFPLLSLKPRMRSIYNKRCKLHNGGVCVFQSALVATHGRLGAYVITRC